MPGRIGVCQDVYEYARMYRSMPGCIRVCQDVYEYARMYTRYARMYTTNVRKIKCSELIFPSVENASGPCGSILHTTTPSQFQYKENPKISKK